MKHGTNFFWQIILVLPVVLWTLLRVRWIRDAGPCRSEPLSLPGTLHDLALGVREVVAHRNQRSTWVLIRHIRQKAYYAC